MKLIIVESPTKAKTLSRFLGNDFKIIASMGHVRDLPKSKLGVEVDNGYKPHYVVPKDKSKNVKILKQEAIGKEKIILATDPDREGEAIAYHVWYLISSQQKKKSDWQFERIVFHEITEKAIKEALNNPRGLDLNLFNAQQVRRVLDRLVGYNLSPLLWYKIKKGLSAGRVQSVALRLIVEREREIKAFQPAEYWLIQVALTKGLKEEESFLADLIAKNGTKLEIKNKTEADQICQQLKHLSYVVDQVQVKEVKRFSPPPFTTSTLQQAASNRLGFSSKQTMRLAQALYEEGLITYHRTDSLNLAVSAIEQARVFIEKEYGQSYLPIKPIFYKTKSKNAQEAHEAIRPTRVDRQAQEINLDINHQWLYELIRQRFIACQMKEAVYSQTTVDIKAGDYLFRAVGTVAVFPGWRVIYGVKKGDILNGDNGEKIKLPSLVCGDKLNLVKILPWQKFTQPPARFTEASLIKTLEEYGIGRPSTYAPTLSTIQERGYVIKQERRFQPTDLGVMVNDFLVKFFPKVVDFNFTAQMEENLDKIARGELKWVPVIDEFFQPFAKEVDKVKKNTSKVVLPVVPTGETCPSCGSSLVFKEGRFGRFVACSRFPQCRFTKSFTQKIGLVCPLCQQGEVVVKKTKKGRSFFGCSRYPACQFASWQKPAS